MTLADLADRLAAEFASDDEEGEELRRLPDRTWKRLVEAGFLRALQPTRWGGGEVHLRDFVDAVMAISTASPSAGWVAGVIGVHPWQLALFDEQAQREMWSDNPTRMHSSSYNPTGKAEKVDGGYRLSGRWSFSSGCDHSEGVILGAICGSVDVGLAKPIADFRSFLLLLGQYRIEDNWYVAGLKGTGSKDIVAENAFVPEHRTQSHLDYAMGNPLPGQQTNPGLLYRLPWSVVFNVAVVASVLGSARGFVETWTAENSPRRITGGDRVADDPFARRRLADALWALDAAVALVHSDIDAMWAMAEAGVTASMDDRAHWRWNMNRSCDLVGDAVAELFRSASGRAIFLDHPLQRRFQDVQGALSHAFLAPDPLAKAVGGARLGTTRPELVL